MLRSSGRFTHCYWTSSGQEWQFHIATVTDSTKSPIGRCTHTDISGQEWQFHIATTSSGLAISYWQIKWSRMVISHCYWHLVVKNGNFTLHWHQLVKNGNYTLFLTSSGQEWQFPILTSSGQEWQFNIDLLSHIDRSTGQEWQFPIATDI